MDHGPDPGKPLLELRKISRSYGLGPVVHALQDADLTVSQGEWLAVTGPSGAGKSTLLHIIGLLDNPNQGEYLFEGLRTSSLKDIERTGLRRRIGFVFQAFHLLPYRNVLENVMLAEVYSRLSPAGRRDRALAAIEQVGLAHRADFLPNKLSGGERQRVAIARALLGNPALLLCDEPTGNLDSKSAASLLDLLEALNDRGLTIIVVTHDETVAQRARRQVEILDGRLNEIRSDGQRQNGTGKLSLAAGNGVDERPALRKPGLSLRDLAGEVLAGMFARPGRLMLTILGVLIGMTALVATIGLSRTAGNRIISQFDELAATAIYINARSTALGVDPEAIPWDAPERLLRLNGVVAAGTLSEVDVGEALVSSSPVRDPLNQTAFKLTVQAASEELFSAVRAQLSSGRFPDLGHSQRLDRVAVLGPNAASRLRIQSVEQLPAIAIGDQLYLVVGILENVARQPDLLGSVIIPEGTARKDFGLSGPGLVVVETRIGAASLIARQAPLALRPDDPGALRVEYPPEPQRVREAVQSDLNVMLLLLGGLSLIVGAIGIGNITLVSVIERTGEIGLRRAIGATRFHIALQFLLESAATGLIGGLMGVSLGVLIVVAVSAVRVWTPVLDPQVPMLAPVIGTLIGLFSGMYPALRAASLEPVEAFRR